MGAFGDFLDSIPWRVSSDRRAVRSAVLADARQRGDRDRAALRMRRAWKFTEAGLSPDDAAALVGIRDLLAQTFALNADLVLARLGVPGPVLREHARVRDCARSSTDTLRQWAGTGLPAGVDAASLVTMLEHGLPIDESVSAVAAGLTAEQYRVLVSVARDDVDLPYLVAAVGAGIPVDDVAYLAARNVVAYYPEDLSMALGEPDTAQRRLQMTILTFHEVHPDTAARYARLARGHEDLAVTLIADGSSLDVADVCRLAAAADTDAPVTAPTAVPGTWKAGQGRESIHLRPRPVDLPGPEVGPHA